VNVPPELDFLGGLRSASSAEAAWSRFAEGYTPLLLRVCRRYGADHDDVLDCYMHVCGRLIEDDYRRLVAFRGETERDFAAWLAAVARNLCIDYLRQRQGRRRLPSAVAREETLVQEVFSLVYWNGLTPAETHEKLRGRHAGLELSRVEEALDRIDSTLRPYRLAELGSSGPRAAGGERTEAAAEVLDERPDPETELIYREQIASLRAEVAALDPADQALLRLRFDHGLTLSEAAAALDLGDHRKAGLRLARIFDFLRERLAGSPRS